LLTPREIIKKLKVVRWVYNSIKQLGDKVHYGFIAQDLLETFGDKYNFVSTEEEFMKVNYEELIGPIVGFINELDEKIDAQEKRITELEKLLKDRK
jgi:hypothetical protein